MMNQQERDELLIRIDERMESMLKHKERTEKRLSVIDKALWTLGGVVSAWTGAVLWYADRIINKILG